MNQRIEQALSRSDADLSPRELQVLRELAGEHDARVGFQGLRRRLGLHPQALTRALRGLERSGYVSRDDSGYRLLDKGFALLSGTTSHEDVEYIVAMRALLPTHLEPSQLSARLAGRWFRGLHWYGMGQNGTETDLIWSMEQSDARVRIRIVSGSVLVEVESDPADPAKHLVVLRPLLEAISELYAAPGHRTAIPTAGG